MTSPRKKPTVADLKALKGKTQLTMLRYFSMDEAAAAERAGIDIASVPEALVTDPEYRKAAPTVFSMTGKAHLEAGTPDEYLRYSGKMLMAGADAIYCSGSMETVKYLTKEFIPIVGHVGLVPSRATWTGGFVAVGKTAESAIALYDECRRYQDAGAFAVEIEVVPVEVATAISAKLDLLLWSMGAGPGCDAQYLFAEDILGTNRGHMPRHAKVYRNFAAEYDRLQEERVKAFQEFRSDVASGAYPQDKHVVKMDPREHAKFLKGIE
ncbi:3-methyl-2-oxobutanoate hydroxymethyltransferase [Aestuariivirga litoralis]|uniref:3-methyl-2-oxobutanoate hydroxymethyltransferase n=1 Tax=Aestuariivirga litoralis TaxID=2650924 RepID=UPI0018C4F62A|nr:3-methyl-2-oxobutanoate hydroxymethyltransferase [Aestuariivirga litoralis]MBG1232355.1 3-methyl-2-oxobutanoate hydroxymethyltransferase [Aestuariivirga litoralis]